MSEILREKQKAEALKRMRLMGLREDFIRDFEEDGKVHICTFQKTYPELSAEDTEMVRQFEQKHHALVYLILRVHTILGDLDSLLYVGQYTEEWPMDLADLKEGYPLSYTANRGDGGLSEFGSIQITKTDEGGFIRVGYAYKGKFIVTDESLELTAYGDGTYEKPFGAPRWTGQSLEDLERWLEQIADEYDKLAEVPGWETEQPAERILRKAPWHELSPNILVKLVRSNQFVGVKTYCRKHGSHGRFLIKEVILRWLLEAEIGAVKFDSDCGDYVKIVRGVDSLQFSFAWLSTCGDDSVKGFRQDITIPLLSVQLVLDDGETQKYLYIPPEPCARIITCHAARTIREIVKDKQKRRALSKGLRDCFRWANETVTLYPDGKDSFFFTTKSGCPKNGGLILHEGVRHGYPCLYYCVHT